MSFTQFSVEDQLEAIQAGTVQVTPLDDLRAKLSEGRRLNVKLGCDPSRPDLHLGHLVVIRKLKTFQRLGHHVTLIIGDFTAMIGDPTGRSKTRPALSLEETQRNGQTYIDQIKMVLDTDPDKLTVVSNSDWLSALSFKDVIGLAGKYTVARMLERNDFDERFKSEKPISIHEFLYPLAQAYDSVVIDADVEIGGTDQTFNLMVGRDIQQAFGHKPQVILTVPVLVGTDGVEKMSKSMGNAISLTESAESMFEKLMRIPDTALADYFALLTDLAFSQDLRDDPVEAHRVLAGNIVASFWGEDAVQRAKARYETVASGSLPDEMPTRVFPVSELASKDVCDLARMIGLVSSKSEARRLIQQSGLKIDGNVVTDVKQTIDTSIGEIVMQRGKNRFCRIRIE